MASLTKLALGMMGKLRPEPAKGSSTEVVALPPPDTHGGLTLMKALEQRRSTREFVPAALPLGLLSSLLWAACGRNRPDAGRTAPSALDAQEIDVTIALPSGACRYDESTND